jgi:hypothetical protein
MADPSWSGLGKGTEGKLRGRSRAALLAVAWLPVEPPRAQPGGENRSRSASTSGRTKQSASWSFTRPIACMNE